LPFALSKVSADCRLKSRRGTNPQNVSRVILGFKSLSYARLTRARVYR
jgi:hypothetical protein